MLYALYLYFNEKNVINKSILLYRYFDNIILFSVNDDPFTPFPIVYPHNIDLRITNLTNSAVNFMDVNIPVLGYTCIPLELIYHLLFNINLHLQHLSLLT